jgi:alkylated DNA nucleotide flippase Atl1
MARSRGIVDVRLRLRGLGAGEERRIEVPLVELEVSERGVAVGATFYPWRRVIDYEWEVEETEEPEHLRARQLIVRVLLDDLQGGIEEHLVHADRFEVGPWTLSMLLSERVEPEAGRAVFRRVTVPWHRVLEYERLVSEGGGIPARPDVEGSGAEALPGGVRADGSQD